MNMRAEALDLSALRSPLETALQTYQQLYDDALTFGPIPEFIRTPEKPNTARAVIPVTHEGAKVGDMCAIVFFPGDGTGDAKTYAQGSLVVPPGLQYQEKSERVIPRSKQGIVREGCFPLFSVREDGTPAMFTTSLEELTVDAPHAPQRIVRAWKLGLTDSAYANAIASGTATPYISCTVGADFAGRRFGDPHAIHNGTAIVQVAGFLAVGADNPLLPLTEGWKLPPGYR